MATMRNLDRLSVNKICDLVTSRIYQRCDDSVEFSSRLWTCHFTSHWPV